MNNDIAKKNLNKLSQEIDKLAELYRECIERNAAPFWKQVEVIQGLFKTVKPLNPKDRDKMWSMFGNYCSDFKAERKRYFSMRERVSGYKRQLVEEKIKDAYYAAMNADSFDGLRHANEILQKSQDWMKDGWQGFGAISELFSLSDGIMTRKDKDFCWEKWTSVKDTIKKRRMEIQKVNFNNFTPLISSIWNEAQHGNPHDALQLAKKIQLDMKASYLEKDDRKVLRTKINEAWEYAISRINEINAEKIIKEQEWRERTAGHIARWSSLLEKNEGVIDHLRDLIEGDKRRILEARSVDYATDVAGWIEEKIEKIRDIEATNSSLAAKIADAMSKLKN